MPVLPPVRPLKRLMTDGTDTASANVERARYAPSRRSAARPISVPKTAQTIAAIGTVQKSGTPACETRIASV
jgi:hypothetical protein